MTLNADHPVHEVFGEQVPRAELERRLAAIFAGVLGIEHVGVHDDFFALGGDSLGAVRLAARIATRERLAATAAGVFAAPTAAGLARELAGRPLPDQAGIPSLPRIPRRAAPDVAADRGPGE